MRHIFSSRTGGPRGLGAFAGVLAASLIVGLSLLVGTGSAGPGTKPRGSSALPKTRNACNDTHVVTCRWDVTIVAESHERLRSTGESREMDAEWTATYRNLLLGLPTAAQLAVTEKEPEGDIIRMGWTAKGVTAGKISFAQSTPGVPDCSWKKSYRVPTLVTVSTYLKLLTPIGSGIGSGFRPWSFHVGSYYNREVGETGDYCQPGNTEAVSLAMPESRCCRLGGP